MNKIVAYVRMAACCSMALLTVEARAQLEGTLFTQPDEREYLDYLRQEFMRANAAEDFDIEDVVIPEIPEDVVAVEPAGPVEYSFGGVMARRDGVRVWLNGQLLGESELPEGFSVVEAGRSFSLRVVHEGQTFVLLPGQTVDVTAGSVIENFQRAQPPAETTAAPPAETAVDAVPSEGESPDAPVAAAQALPETSGGNAASGEALAGQDPDIDTDALSAAASRLGDSEVDALFEILENRRLERGTGDESDEESDNEEP